MRQPLLKVLRPFEYPVIDREPLEKWRDRRVTLIRDAAHATYPVGSSGASQAIVDTRVLGAAVRTQGVTIQALGSYEANVRPTVNAVTRANRAPRPQCDHANGQRQL